jgi:hypothetical protein
MMVPICHKAIRYVNMGDYEHEIRMPQGVTWRGNDYAPASAVVESFHLDGFLDEEHL